jgi:hypothetical protein
MRSVVVPSKVQYVRTSRAFQERCLRSERKVGRARPCAASDAVRRRAGRAPLRRRPRHPRAAQAAWARRQRLLVRARRAHLGVEADLRPARKAYADLAALVTTLEAAGHPTRNDEPLPGYDRVYVDTPFGNRLELLEPSRG